MKSRVEPDEPASDHDQSLNQPRGSDGADEDAGTDDQSIEPVGAASDELERPDAQRLRLNDAVSIVIDKPDISGTELANELRTKGWSVSSRTATRVLRAARQEARTGHHSTLTAVGG